MHLSIHYHWYLHKSHIKNVLSLSKLYSLHDTTFHRYNIVSNFLEVFLQVHIQIFLHMGQNK